MRKAFLTLSLLFAGLTSVIPAIALEFSDVPDNHFATIHITKLVEEGIIQGYPDGTFKPNKVVNRAEIAKIAYYLALRNNKVSVTPGAGTSIEYKDVDKNSWYEPFLIAMTNAGILEGFKKKNGEPLGMFDPGGNVTRAQAAKVVTLSAGLFDELDEYRSASNHLEYPTYLQNFLATKVPYIDVAEEDWFYDYVKMANEAVIADGYKDAEGSLTGKFGPNDPVTRGQLAKMIHLGMNPVDRGQGNMYIEAEAKKEKIFSELANSTFCTKRTSTTETGTGSFLDDATLVFEKEEPATIIGGRAVHPVTITSPIYETPHKKHWVLKIIDATTVGLIFKDMDISKELSLIIEKNEDGNYELTEELASNPKTWKLSPCLE